MLHRRRSALSWATTSALYKLGLPLAAPSDWGKKQVLILDKHCSFARAELGNYFGTWKKLSFGLHKELISYCKTFTVWQHGSFGFYTHLWLGRQISHIKGKKHKNLCMEMMSLFYQFHCFWKQRRSRVKALRSNWCCRPRPWTATPGGCRRRPRWPRPSPAP